MEERNAEKFDFSDLKEELGQYFKQQKKEKKDEDKEKSKESDFICNL